jgi:hypothetical protein
MHTLDRQPAYYEPGKQVVFAGWECRRLCASLRQIRREWAASEAWREKMEYNDAYAEHSYVRVRVPLFSSRADP